MSQDEGFDVFLSYNSSDRPTVTRLGEKLRDRGLKVWLDVWELPPGRLNVRGPPAGAVSRSS